MALDIATDEGELLVQYWDSGPVPDYIAELVASFEAHNPGMRRLMFDRSAAEEFIEDRIGEREAAAFRACAVPTMQSDYLRYCAVFALGGVYSDVGFRCMRPLRPLIESTENGLLVRSPAGYVLSGFFSFRRPGHPLPRLALEVITRNIERRIAEQVQVVTGPWILSGLVLLRELATGGADARAAAEEDLRPLADRFRRQATASAPTRNGLVGLDGLIESLLGAAGGRTRLEEAFEGVRIATFEETQRYFRKPEEDLPYRKSDSYWINWQRQGRTIFS